MNADARPVWVVAGAGTCRRWSRALGDEGLEGIELPWSVLRPDPQLDRLATALADAPERLVLFTSRSAVAVLPDGVGVGRRCACVGPGTARAASACGFEVALVGAAGGAALARSLLAELPEERAVLFLRGREARPEAEDALLAAGVGVRSLTVYRMDVQPDFAAVVRAAPEPSAILLGSPRAADALHEALAATDRPLPPSVVLVAPGAVTAAHAGAKFGRAIQVAQHVDPAGLAQSVHEALSDREE